MMRAEELSQQTQLQSVRDGAAFARLRREWDELLDASMAGVFNSWEWLYPWYRRIAPQRELMVLLARDPAGELVGLMPLCLSRVRVAGRSIRRLSFLGETHVGSDYLDLVAPRGREEQAASLFAQAIWRARAGWDLLELLDLDQDSPTVRVFRDTFARQGWRFELRERFTCPFEVFPPGIRFDQFLQRTGRRENFLRRWKWLSRQPGYLLELSTTPGQLATPMAEFFRLHALRWAPQGGSMGIKGAGVEAFHRDASEYLAERGMLRLYTLKLGATALASVYGIVHRKKFIYFQSGFDPGWAQRSVGLVLVGETFRQAIESGLYEYDFLRGTEPYKADWTTQERRTVAIRVFARHSRGAWLSRRDEAIELLGDLAKRALPARAVEAIRRMRLRQAAI